MTDRMVAAIESGVVHCIGHPFARMFGKRDPIPLDFDRVLEACREHHVALEISGQPERLDLPDVYARTAAEHGVPLVVSTDAHRIDNLDYMKYGIAQARRGWVQKKHVWNTVSAVILKKRVTR
ncbi:MAG: hypothetical protein GF341_04545 [candidate division Zixibacteria bacterium]|nr:hypothetical protein [candidate division Zixibacteria bacterium]